MLNVQNTVSLNDVSEDVKHNIFSSHSLPSNSSPATAATKRHGLVTNQWSCHTFFTISKGSKGKTIKEEKYDLSRAQHKLFRYFLLFLLILFFVFKWIRTKWHHQSPLPSKIQPSKQPFAYDMCWTQKTLWNNLCSVCVLSAVTRLGLAAWFEMTILCSR